MIFFFLCGDVGVVGNLTGVELVARVPPPAPEGADLFEGETLLIDTLFLAAALFAFVGATIACTLLTPVR